MNRVVAAGRTSFNPFRSKSTPPLPAYAENISADAIRRYSPHINNTSGENNSVSMHKNSVSVANHSVVMEQLDNKLNMLRKTSSGQLL